MNRKTQELSSSGSASTSHDQTGDGHDVQVTDRRDLGHPSTRTAPDETLILDSRSRLSPAQVVEDKLMRIFRDPRLPVAPTARPHDDEAADLDPRSDLVLAADTATRAIQHSEAGRQLSRVSD